MDCYAIGSNSESNEMLQICGGPTSQGLVVSIDGLHIEPEVGGVAIRYQLKKSYVYIKIVVNLINSSKVVFL